MAEVKVGTANFEEEVLRSDVPVLVDFWAPWCGPCMMLGPVLEEIAEDYEGKLKVAKINADDNMDLCQKYQVVSIPLLILFKDGNIIYKMVGYHEKEEIDEILKEKIAE